VQRCAAPTRAAGKQFKLTNDVVAGSPILTSAHASDRVDRSALSRRGAVDATINIAADVSEGRIGAEGVIHHLGDQYGGSRSAYALIPQENFFSAVIASHRVARMRAR
jgi:hypothetical protein